eukprot:scaffold22852_cov63-Attheya_sp.AAC.1
MLQHGDRAMHRGPWGKGATVVEAAVQGNDIVVAKSASSVLATTLHSIASLSSLITACYSISLACVAWHTRTPHAYVPHMMGDVHTCHCDAAQQTYFKYYKRGN